MEVTNRFSFFCNGIMKMASRTYFHVTMLRNCQTDILPRSATVKVPFRTSFDMMLLNNLYTNIFPHTFILKTLKFTSGTVADLTVN